LANVHTSDAFTALEIVPEATHGTDPGTGYLRVPFRGRVAGFSRDEVEQSREIKPFGGTPAADYGTGHTEVEFTTYAYYNAPWWHNLMCNVMGGMEHVVTGRGADGSSSATTNTHNYIPQSYACRTAGSVGGMSVGITARLWNMGPNNTDGAIEVVTGIRFRELELVWERNGWLLCRWRGIGFKPVRLDGDGLTPAALATTHYKVTPQDILRNAGGGSLPSFFQVGGTSFDFDSFSIRISTDIQEPQRFATDPDGVYNFGIRGNRRVTGTIEGRLYQTALDSGKPLRDFLDAVKDRSIRIRAASTGFGLFTGPGLPSTSGAAPYALDIFLGKTIWTQGEAPIEGPGTIPMRCGFKAYENKYTGSALSYSVATGAADNYKGPILIQSTLDETEDTDTTFTAAARGGNQLDTTLREV